MKMVIVYITNQIKDIISLINKLFSRHEKNSELNFGNVSEKIKIDMAELNSLDKYQKIKINKDIKKMISYYNKLTDQIESRRTRLVESSWQTMAIIIAASGLLIAAKLTGIILYPVLFIFGIQIFFAILKLYEYQAQSGFKYPFNNSGYGNKWKWFYYANPFIKSINPNPYNKQEFENQKNLLLYLEGLHYF
ncbi:MAG: hypothetical protein GX642_15305, partial [Smithella sp.]|nr:hypothetical protein [Smithella sp.]